jgi:protocatechuate 3,4-dioxygenase beta subunit
MPIAWGRSANVALRTDKRWSYCPMFSAPVRSSTTTESSVLGPFHNKVTHLFENGQSIGSHGVSGEPMLIHGTVRATDYALVEGATVDIWETNGNGFYDMQDPNLDGPDCQGVFHNDRNGRYYLLGVKSIDYNLPSGGPVGKLLHILDRNITRPAHIVCFRS